MKEIVSSVFRKIVESKIPESQLEPYNPFAVCNKSVGTEKTKKRERCIHHLKEQNEESNSCSGKDSSITTEKPALWNPNALLPKDEDQFVDDTQGSRLHRPAKKKHRPLTWEELEKRMQEIKVGPHDLVASGNRSIIIEPKRKCKICSK